MRPQPKASQWLQHWPQCWHHTSPLCGDINCFRTSLKSLGISMSGWWLESFQRAFIYDTGPNCTDDVSLERFLEVVRYRSDPSRSKVAVQLWHSTARKRLLQSADWVPQSISLWGVLTRAGRLSIRFGALGTPHLILSILTYPGIWVVDRCLVGGTCL